MKFSIIILLIILPFLAIKGQTLNFQIGPSFSKLNWYNSLMGDVGLDYNSTGVNLLIGVDYWDHKYFNLSSNLGFIQKGGKDSISVTNEYGEEDSMMLYTERLNYLTLNTTFIAKIPVSDSWLTYIHLGPRLDYMVSYKEDIGLMKQFDDFDKVNDVIYGFITGIGVNYKIDNISLGVVFNYYINLNKIVNYTLEDNDFSNKLSDRTFTLNFKVGYKL